CTASGRPAGPPIRHRSGGGAPGGDGLFSALEEPLRDTRPRLARGLRRPRSSMTRRHLRVALVLLFALAGALAAAQQDIRLAPETGSDGRVHLRAVNARTGADVAPADVADP